jgi:hypothetical protein
MITAPQAELFIQQFSLMKNFPTSKDPQCADRIELLVDHFRRACQSDDHGHRMVDWVQQNKRFCPEPCDLWDAAKATSGANITEGDKPRYRECSRCCEGFTLAFQHVRWSQDRRPTAGFISETIADDLLPSLTEIEFRRDIDRHLTSQQHARFETLYNAFPPGHHSRFVLAAQRCRRCWDRVA